MTVYELLTLYKPYELLFDISSSVNFNDVVSRMERPSITGKVSVLHLMIYVTEFAKRGLIRAFTNIEKCRFEILNAVYLENAQSFFHAILHHSTVTQGNSFGVLFNGLLAELPAILDSFFTSTTSGGWLGVVGSHEVAGKNTRQVLTPP